MPVTTCLEAEAQLGFEFSKPLSPHPLFPRSVFLTGATGFLGVFLLDELLRKTEAKVYCLVRARDDAAAHHKLVSRSQSYGLWLEENAPRIQVFSGDLSEPYFGLGCDQFQDLAVRTDVIYHSAGCLNMALPYERLRSANVTATKEVLRLAGTESTKPLHFVSSIAVFYTDLNEDGPMLLENDTPACHSSLRGGYSQSKWVADRLVASAQERGLPACIYRPVRIMGHSQTGTMYDASDILPLLVKGCILLGQYPALDIRLTLVPVDYVSRAMVYLAGQKRSWGRSFHMFNLKPIQWEEMMSILRSNGYLLQPIAYDQWWRTLKQQVHNREGTEETQRALSNLFLAMTAPHFLHYKRPPMDDRNIREGLEGSGILCHPVDAALISTYLSFWQNSGFLPVPSARRRAAVV